MGRCEVDLDDARRGELPDRCVLTGEPADREVRVDALTGFTAPGPFLTTVGALGVLVRIKRPSRRDVVRLPMGLRGAQFHHRWSLLRRLCGAYVYVGLLVTLTLFVVDGPRLLVVGSAFVLVLAVVGVEIGDRVIANRFPGIVVDESRGRVVLIDVADEFAEAVWRTYMDRRWARRERADQH